MASCLSSDTQTRLRCCRVRSLAMVQKFAGDAERRRRVHEARKQVSSRDVQKFASGRGLARWLAVRLVRSCADHGLLLAFGLYMSLRHPVPLGDCSVQSCTRVRPTVCYEPLKWHECTCFLLSGLSGYFQVSQQWRPPKSVSRVLLCSFWRYAALALKVISSIFLAERAVGVG